MSSILDKIKNEGHHQVHLSVQIPDCVKWCIAGTGYVPKVSSVFEKWCARTSRALRGGELEMKEQHKDTC